MPAILTDVVDQIASGEFGGRANSADDERSGAIHLTLSPVKHIVLHGQFSYTQTDDRSIPGFALNERMQALLTPQYTSNSVIPGRTFERADAALYEAKRAGRDRVVAA